MRRLRLLSLLTALLVAAGVPAGAFQANAYEPPGWSTFNVPKPWGGVEANFRIVRTIETAIRKTRPSNKDPKPVINVATYLLDHSPGVDAMIAACRRGVQVRVILDEDIENRNSRRLIKALNSDNVQDKNDDGVPDNPPSAGPCNRKLVEPKQHRKGKWARTDPTPRYYDKRFNRKSLPVDAARKSVDAQMRTDVTWGEDGSYVKRCDGSCRGAGGNMHSKFFLFSHAGKAKHVVMVSSSNLNRGGAELGWNDLFVMKDRPVSYDGYVKIHREMTNDNKAGVDKVEIDDGKYVSRFFPIKDAGKGNDPTLEDLNRIKCADTGANTQINVSMFYWKGSRGDYLLDKLVELARDKCNVSVIYGAPSRIIAGRLRELARNGVIKVYDSRWDFNQDGFNEVRTHAKYVLVNGQVDGEKDTKHVWTGSQNWVAGSLSRGDETTLNIKSGKAWRQYIAHWNNLRAHSRKVPR